MPNSDGYHDTGFVLAGESVIWHYCKGADRDTLVKDNVKAKREHLRVCTKRQQKEAKRIQKQNERKRLDALALARRMRRMAV